jgi:uncharacterized protein (DUF885 family)
MMRLAAVLLSAVSLALTCAPAGARGSDDSTYTRLAAQYFKENFAANPPQATAAGLHSYDLQLGSYGARDFAASLVRDRRFLRALAAIDPGALSPDVALDRAMLVNSLEDDLLLNGRMQLWRHKPDSYAQLASFAIYELIERAFAPLPVRMRAVIARENAIPTLYAQARANVIGTDAASAKIALDDVQGSVSFLAHDVPAAFSGVRDAAAQAALRGSTARALAATRRFAAWLKGGFVAHPVGTFAIGAAAYSARLKYEEAIDMPLAAYLAIGERALLQTHERMVETANRIDPHATVEAVVARVLKVHPTAAELIPAAQADLVKLRAFIVAHHIIDLPADADIKVTLTPPFERSTTVAQMDAPGPLERVATQAYYNVTPVDPRDSRRDQELYLQTFNDFERPIVSAHEVYPGHYTQFVIDKHLPLSLSEKLLGASSFVEGWAHYDEQMMVDEGWGNGDPRVRLMQLKEAILRNARYVVGVKLHTQGMTLAQAQTFFRTQAFLDPADARIEAQRGTQDATYGYYTLGKLEILKLRADYRRKMGAAFTLAGFHAALLAHGSPPIPLLRPFLLGKGDTGSIL